MNSITRTIHNAIEARATYSRVPMGGGCEAFERKLPDGRYMLINNDDAGLIWSGDFGMTTVTAAIFTSRETFDGGAYTDADFTLISVNVVDVDDNDVATVNLQVLTSLLDHLDAIT